MASAMSPAQTKAQSSPSAQDPCSKYKRSYGDLRINIRPQVIGPTRVSIPLYIGDRHELPMHSLPPIDLVIDGPLLGMAGVAEYLQMGVNVQDRGVGLYIELAVRG